MKKLERILLTLLLLIFASLCAVRYFTRDSLPAAPEPTPHPAQEATPAPTPQSAPEPTPEPTPDPDSPTGRALSRGLPTPPDIDIDSWEYILANGENSIAEYTPPEIVTLENQPLDSRIIEPLKAMAQDTRAQGLSVFLSSGYRSYSEQAANFIRVCQNNGVADGKDARGFYITMPAGCSEHQTGLACDITDVYYPVKNSSIENTATFQYMSKHCQDFGFILRFPKDKEEVTGVMYEPFHYRYVGVEAAQYMTENNLCLEEFVSLYRDVAGLDGNA